MKNGIAGSVAAALGYVALGPGLAIGADLEKVNWSGVPKSEIVLFYPGQSSYE